MDTVDAFQGREKDCIIVSCVRANSSEGSAPACVQASSTKGSIGYVSCRDLLSHFQGHCGESHIFSRSGQKVTENKVLKGIQCRNCCSWSEMSEQEGQRSAGSVLCFMC